MACPICGGGGGGKRGPSHVSEGNDLSTYFSTTKEASDPKVQGGSFTSFGSIEADGKHKTTVVYNADGESVKTRHEGGGVWTGGFWNWVAGKVTDR